MFCSKRVTILKSARAAVAHSTCLVCLGVGLAVPVGQCAKKPSKVATADGQPIRRVYIHAASPDIAHSAALRLAQDTCLTSVPTAKEADGVLDVGIALPSVGAGGLQTADTFGPSIQPQTLGNLNKKPERSFSANCSGSKGLSGCTGSSTGSGDTNADQSTGWAENGGAGLDVSLASPGNVSQELWEPGANSKKSWSEQLRIAAGCPVCSHGHFDRKHQTYRAWIRAECPAALAGNGVQ